MSKPSETLVHEVEEEAVLCVPENVRTSVLDLQVLLLELLNFGCLIFVPETAQIDELLEGHLSIMDGHQQRVQAKPSFVDFALVIGCDAGEVRQVLLGVDLLAHRLSRVQHVACTEKEPLIHKSFYFLSIDRQCKHRLILLVDEL